MTNELKKDNIASLRLDDITKTSLERIAQREQRSISQVIYIIINEYILNHGELIKPLFELKEGQ